MTLENHFTMLEISAFPAHGQHRERIKYQLAESVIDGDAIAGLNVGVFWKQGAKILDHNLFAIVADLFP